MGGALHPGMARAGATFELDRLEIVDGRLVVRGWWFGVRGVRFVRPALIVDDRQILATLEHKPWVAAEDGGWTAAFPWKKGVGDIGGVTLVVAPSIEVPLDRDLDPPLPVLREVAAPAVDTPLRDELAGIERELDAMHAELREAKAHAAERDERCRELELVVARERRASDAAQDVDDELVRAHAMAVLDRDRAQAQWAEAVSDREAAVRARTRMERQRDEAVAARAEAEVRRDEALAERDEVRCQRDELLLAHQALRAQLNGSLADADRTEAGGVRPGSLADAARTEAGGARPGSLADAARTEARGARPGSLADAARTEAMPSLPAAGPDPDPAAPARAAGTPPAANARQGRARERRAARPDGRPFPDTTRPAAADADPDSPIGVRTIPAARAVAGSLHRSQRERTAGVTRYDMWAIRILGSVAALAFISLLVMILKAFFVF